MTKSATKTAIMALFVTATFNLSALAVGVADNCSSESCVAAESALPLIDRATLKSQISNVQLVDALDKNCFERSHVKGSVNIPVGSEARVASELLKDKDISIIVYCFDTKCHASDTVGKKLSELGYKHVSIYRAGLQDMIKTGFELEGTNPKKPVSLQIALHHIMH